MSAIFKLFISTSDSQSQKKPKIIDGAKISIRDMGRIINFLVPQQVIYDSRNSQFVFLH